MASKLVAFFVSVFSFLGGTTLGKYIIVFIISCFPIIELRGALPAASCLLHLSPWMSLVFAVLGNMFPVPFILKYIKPLFAKLRKKKFMKKVVLYCEGKADKKKGQIVDLQYYGLFIFVAIPLPGTGAWTGSLIAALLDMDFKKSFLAILLGVIAAGIIMLIVSYGMLGGLCS